MRGAAYYERVAELMRAGRAFATARLLEAAGSVPQKEGAAMIVFPSGAIEGTIGGGRFEATVVLDAMEMIEERKASAVRTYALNREELRMYCAGRAEVLLEAFQPSAELVIFGGGHVGEALGRMSAELGLFRTTLIDDRVPFADPKRHPRVERVIHTDPLYERDIPPLGTSTYAVIVTRCHDVDKTLCRKLAALELGYLGMIGSRTKAATLCRELEDEGVPPEQLARIRTPIGLPLGDTKEPVEVALSILAEVVKVKNEREAAGSGSAPEKDPTPGTGSDPQVADTRRS